MIDKKKITTCQSAQNNMTKRDKIYMLLLAAGTMLLVLLLTRGRYLFGSQIDWVSQHSVLPEYFRQQFYETGRLLPNFAAQLGAGQNIFHFSYYGLLSPVILPSYLFPQLPMTSYLAISSVLLLLCSSCLCYYWLRRNLVSCDAALAAAFLFQFSAALLYHSHKQVMFVDYMPFLLLALLGTDRYFEHRKSGLMMTGIFLMIMTSYFYSVGGLLALTIYGIYRYFRQDSGTGVKGFLAAGLSFALRLLIPVGMSALLLLPSFASILSGRSAEASSAALSSLFFPGLKLLNLLYSPYGIGLTAVSILAVLRLVSRHRSGERILFALLAVVFTLPFFLYLLNGGLYLRGKVFIPFLPVLILVTAFYLQEILERCHRTCRQVPQAGPVTGCRISLRRELVKTGVLCLLLLPLDRSPVWFAFLLESLVITAGFAIGIRRRSFFLCCLPSCALCLMICVGVNLSDPLVTREEAQNLHSREKQELLDRLAAAKDTSFRLNDLTETDASWNLTHPGICRTSLYSSTYDAEYNRFHTSGMGNAMGASNSITCADSDNILFQTFMGVKYLIGSDSAPAGYRSVDRQGPYCLYENEHVFPLGWGSASLMSRKEFDSLPKADQYAALLQYIIVDEAPESDYVSPLRRENLTLPFPMAEDGSRYEARLEEDYSVTQPLPEPLSERLLLLSMSLQDLPDKDIVISANGVANRLTGKGEMYPNKNESFDYVLSNNNGKDFLTLDFSKGTYSFSKPEAFSLDYGLVRSAVDQLSPLETSGLCADNNVMEGTVTMEQDGYFTASIPYDKGFSAFVDGNPQEVELVNTAFLGFPLSAGAHRIELVYQPPLWNTGFFLSKLFFLLFATVLVMEQIAYAAQYLPDFIPDPRKRLPGGIG